MNELTGTVTLAYVEEDNRQRMIFRIVPLSNKDGFLFHGSHEDFPDEGSLRIVPDKREQGTFKERMRSLSGFCAISLPQDGKEKMKIRQNRNYDPEAGEKNRNALYSDVVYEFIEDGCFEVLEVGSDATHALTGKVLLRKAMMLYGPVNAAEVKDADLSALKPFGNDSYLLQTVDTPITGKHQVYWNPEMILSWRQHRQNGKKKAMAEEAKNEAKNEAKAEAGQETAKAAPKAPKNGEAAKPVKPGEPAKGKPVKPAVAEAAKPMPKPADKTAEKPADKKNAPKAAAPVKKPEAPVKPAEDKGRKPRAEAVPSVKNAHPLPEQKPRNGEAARDESDSALPIGENLDILDSAISFDQQLDRLTQPLSENANRLNTGTALTEPRMADPEAPAEEEDLPEVPFHSNATKLTPVPSAAASPARTPVNVFYVVEKALRGHNDESTAAYVNNPIACLRDCVDAIWQDDELREQALNMLMGNGEFVDDITNAFCKKGMDLRVRAAAEEQLSAIMAERLELLTELRLAKEKEKQYQQEAIAKINQRRKDEIEHLKRELERLRQEKNRLLEAEKALSSQNQLLVKDYIGQNATAQGSMSMESTVLSPVVGRHYESDVLAENLRINMNDCGFSISEDDAQTLLICFGLFDAICLDAEDPADAYRFADILLDSLGLQSVSAVLHKDSGIQLVNLLQNSGNATPTVSIQSVGTDFFCAKGHKVIYIATGSAEEKDSFGALLSYPVIKLPPMTRNAYNNRPVNVSVPEPASLSSIESIGHDAKKLLAEAEKWFGDLQDALRTQKLSLSEALFASMRRFVAVASGVLRGGFPVAADTALCLWIVPILLRNHLGQDALAGISDGLSKTNTLLQGAKTHD